MGNTEGSHQAQAGADQQHQSHLQNQQHPGTRALQQIQYSEKDLEYVEQRDEDDAYGEIRVYRLKQQLIDPENVENSIFEIGIKSRIFDNKEACEEYYQSLEERIVVHPNIVQLLKNQKFTNSNLCTSVYKVDLAYEYIRQNLQDEILDKFQTKEFFDENIIFNLIDQVLQALYHFKCHGIIHEDVQPKTILIDNGIFKITDVQFMTSGMCGYRKMLAGVDTECFLAPELLQPLRRSIILQQEEIDQERADVFSLGLIALAMSTLQSVDVIYDFDEYTLREQEILNLLDIVKSQYSNNLYLLLVSMLNQVDRRIDFENGLNLIDQMRSGQFNEEEYEMRRFQSELEQSDKKLADSTQNPLNAQANDNSGFHHPQPISQPQQHQPSPQEQAYLEEQAYLKEQENIKKAARKEAQQPQDQANSHNFDNNKNNSSHPPHQPQQIMPQQPQQPQQGHQSLNTPQNFNHNNPHNHNLPSNTPNSDQNADRFDPHHQNSGVKQGQHGFPPSNIPHQNQANLEDIDSRVREALIRSQQVSLKFENSPLRLFRDQLLSDELYIPLDPQLNNSQHQKSRNLDSGKKNPLQLSQQQNKIVYPNNSPGFSQQKSIGGVKKNQNQSQSRLLQKKWKI